MGPRPAAQYRVADVGFFDLFGVPILEGRDIAPADRPDAPLVVLVNRAFAERHWPGGSAVGRRVRLDSGVREIVGVVADFREWGGAEAPPAMLFVPFAQRPVYTPALAVRSTLPDATLAALLRREVRALDPAVPLYQVQSMDTVVELAYQGERTLGRLLMLFAGMALLLAVLGVCAVMAYDAARRRQEVGIRIALGADAGRILRLMLGRGLTLGLLGTTLGLLLASAAARLLAAFLFGVSPRDPATFILFGGLLLVAALAATAVPALRAARVDPLAALRSD